MYSETKTAKCIFYVADAICLKKKKKDDLGALVQTPITVKHSMNSELSLALRWL